MAKDSSTQSDMSVEALKTLTAYLDAKDWKAKQVEGRSAFKARKNIDLCPLDFYFQIIPKQEQFLFYISPVLTFLPSLLNPVSEYVARANFGMRIGNFEVDYAGCKISFRSGLNFHGHGLSTELLDGAVQPALKAFEEFFPGLADVIAGISAPADAIRKIEYGE